MRKLNENQEYRFTVEFRNGERYCYYGDTKKEAINNFKNKWFNFKGFTKKEWEIVDK
jgi:hypothetical protein